MLSKRVQILLEEDDYKKLKSLGKKARKSLGEIFREAVKLYGERLLERSKRLETVEKMSRLRAPVEDWPKMKKGILRQRYT